MAIERKFVDLKALKVSEEGPGTIEGYRAVFGVLDEGGDIIVKGAFASTIPEYLRTGFTAESHDWDFAKSVGFPIEAKEDDFGWFVVSQFHSTPDAQNIRTKAIERMGANKQVGFSFGYKTDEYEVIEHKDFKDQLPLYVKPEALEETLKKAQKFSRIRILQKVSAMEDSLVTAPMNKLAGATAVKSEAPTKFEGKGLFEDAIAACEESLYFLCDKLMTAIYRAQMIDEYAEDSGGTFDLPAAVDEILSEFSVRVRASVLDEDQQEDTGVDDGETASFRGPVSFKGDLRSRLPFAKHAETVLGAVEVFAKRNAAVAELITELATRSKSIMELREAKAGAVYSSSNLSHMHRIHNAIGKVKKDVSAMHSDMGALIDKAKKKDEKSEDDLDAAALRAQSLRLQSQALMH